MKLQPRPHDTLTAPYQIGRPRREEGKRPSVARSVRLPVTLWKQLEREAKRKKTTLNAAMREAAVAWLKA